MPANTLMSASAPANGARRTRPRVLSVDDEPNVLEGLMDNLRRSFEVTTATSGATDQHEPPARLAGAGVGADQDPKAGRVHELEPAQVEHEHRRTVGLDPLQLILEPAGGRDVELSAQRHLNGAVALLDR